MTIEELIASAGALTQPPASAAGEFAEKQDLLADRLNKRLGSRDDLARLIGEGNQAMMEDNSRNFCRFMASMFDAYDPRVMVQTVLWVFRAYRSHGFQLTFWPAELDVFVELLRDELSPESFTALYPFYNWMIVNIPSFVEVTDQQIDGFTPPSHG